MHCSCDERHSNSGKAMDMKSLITAVQAIYTELSGEAELMNDPSVQPEIQKLAAVYDFALPMESPPLTYPLLLSVSSTRLRQLVQDRYAGEYESYVENLYNRRWGGFAMDAGFCIFNYESQLLEHEPGLASYLNSDDQRCYLAAREFAEKAKWLPHQVALYVQLCDTALGIVVLRQIRSSYYISSLVRHELQRVVSEVKRGACITSSSAPRTAQSFSTFFQQTSHGEIVSLVVIAKEMSTLLALNNPTLRAVSHRQLTAIIGPTLVWMITHEPKCLPMYDENFTTTETTGKPMTEEQARALFEWSTPPIMARRQWIVDT